MMTPRPAAERGHADRGWLKSWHSFSFGDYYDPAHQGFSALRVINEDIVAPGKGFATHGHRDMEILTYVLSGELKHEDSMGNGSVIRPGDVQHMSAGTGVHHSEVNPSETLPVHLLQIWILPKRQGIPPHYGQTHFPIERRHNRLCLVASGEGREGSLAINQDANLYVGNFDTGETLEFVVINSRRAWLQVARGSVECEGITLSAGDGAGFNDTDEVKIIVREEAELLLFDLP